MTTNDRIDRSETLGRDRRAGGAPRAAEHPLAALQRQAGNQALVQLLGQEAEGATETGAAAPEGRSPVLDVVGQGGGAPLDPGAREQLESGLGADFSDVRVHTDGPAGASAEAVGASAYTVGHEVVFAPGHYQPGTPQGQRTLAHELTHVVQQRQGPVAGTDTGTGIALSHPSDSFEQAAEAGAEEYLAGSVQREEAGAEEEPLEAQSLAVGAQRDADGVEPEDPTMGAQREEAAVEEDPTVGAQREEAGLEEDPEAMTS
jgi:hypothetical protein